MPIYEYRCASCGRTVEVFAHSASALTPPTTCACGQTKSMTRILSSFATLSANETPSCGEECCHRDTSCRCCSDDDEF